jgi:transcriptional regulator with XRE-family HTH domain
MQKDEYAKAFGEYLKSLLEEKGMTQAELARRTGLTEASVSRYINGNRSPRIAQAYRMALVIGIDMNTLIFMGKGDDERCKEKNQKQ